LIEFIKPLLLASESLNLSGALDLGDVAGDFGSTSSLLNENLAIP